MQVEVLRRKMDVQESLGISRLRVSPSRKFRGAFPAFLWAWIGEGWTAINLGKTICALICQSCSFVKIYHPCWNVSMERAKLSFPLRERLTKMMQEPYSTVSDFARKFRVSTTIVYRLIKDGTIPAVKIGEKNYRISPQTIESIEAAGLFSGRRK